MKNVRKRFLSALLALALVLALVPVTALADNEAASINGTPYDTLQAAIDEAASGATITLLREVEECVLIPSGKTVTINLNGKTLKNGTATALTGVDLPGHNESLTANYTDTISVLGNLTINGPGIVQYSGSSAMAAIVNYSGGTVEINGGEYSTDNTIDGSDAWYTIKNMGTMTINNALVSNSDPTSSLIVNGWYNGGYGSGNDHNTKFDSVNASLTINGGNFSSGGANVIKNDDYGVLTINNGRFTGRGRNVIQNANIATIKGGVFSAKNISSMLMNYGKEDAAGNQGSFNISNATFISDSDINRFFTELGGTDTGKITISNATVEKGTISGSNLQYEIEIQSGTFTSNVPDDYLASAAAYIESGGKHYVGLPQTVAQAVSNAAPGSTVTVKKGAVDLDLAAGVQVVNESGSTITVNGDPVPTGQIVTSRIQNTEPITSDLVVTRQVDGSSQPVQIQVTLGRVLTGSYGGHYFDHGVGVFTLQPGQSLYFHDLPANMTYDVAVLDGLVTAESNMSGTTLPNLTNSMYTNVTFAALPGVTPPDVVPGEEEIIEGEEELITPGEEEGDVQEGTEETVPEEGETPEEGLEELPEEGEVPTEEPVDVPKTGDSLPSIGLALLFGLAACAVVLKKARAK